MSLKDKIKASFDRQEELVPVPEWGVDVLVKGMSARDRYAVFKAARDEDQNLEMEVLFPRIIIATCHDPETGEKVFTEEDEEWLMQKSPQALDRVANVGMRVSGISKESEDEGKDT